MLIHHANTCPGFRQRGFLVPALLMIAWLLLLFLVIRYRLHHAGYGFSGDEPHYLLICDSIVSDGDLELTNQYVEKSQLLFKQSLDVHGRVVRDNKLVSIHHIGLPAILIPAFMAAGIWGATGFMMLVSIGVSLLLFRFLIRRGCSVWGAAGVVSLIMGGAPLVFYSSSIFPEMIAAGCVLLALSGFESGVRASIPLAFSLVILPWLHLRFSVLAIGIILAGAIASGLKKAFQYLLLPFVCSLGCNFFYYWQVYGHPLYVQHLHPTPSINLTVIRNGIGLFFDQRFGVVLYAPFLLLLPFGMYLLFRTDRQLFNRILVIGTPYFLLISAFPEWWGGWAPPGRYLVPLLPLGAILLWLPLQVMHRSKLTWVIGVFTLSSALITRQLIEAPKSLYNRIDMPGRLLKEFHIERSVRYVIPDVFSSWTELILATTVLSSIILTINIVLWYRCRPYSWLSEGGSDAVHNH